VKFFIAAGEESGEIYGARLINEIKKLHPEAEFTGLGGDRMVKEGLSLLYHCRDLSAIGLVDILKKIVYFKSVIDGLKSIIREGGYDAVILIDAPELNFRLGKAAHEAGIPVFYYVCPQLWSWRTYRVNSVRQWVDTMLVILPFEEEFYRGHNVNVRFVGHPMIEEIHPPDDRGGLRREFMPDSSRKLVGLLPGSRNAEIAHILPGLIETADIIYTGRRDVGFVLPVSRGVDIGHVREQVGQREFITIVRGRSHDVMAASDMLITKSGTSTLEAALIGVPMIIVYRTSFLSYWFAKLLAHVKLAGLPNLIAGKEIATEYLQYAFRPETVASEALALLGDDERLTRKKEELADVRRQCGEKGAAGNAAGYIVERLKTLHVEENK